MGVGGVISNLLSLGAKLLPAVVVSAQDPSSSSSPALDDQNNQIEAELKKLMRMLERIKATLYDAEQREITDSSVKLWLKELKGVAYDAEDVLGEYHYELLRAQVEERDASPPDSRKRKRIQFPYNMLDEIRKIRSIFDEIAKDRIALQLSEGDGPKRCDNKLYIAPTSHFQVESNIFGREREKEKLVDLLSSECDDVVLVVAMAGMGGVGKTTLARLVYNDQRIRKRFDKFGWICVSDDFNVERLSKESVEFITGKKCGLSNLSVLQEKIQKKISGKRVLLVLDDIWNENINLWYSFKAPFMSAAFAKILVTTRNDSVARIMQTEPTINLGSLSAEQCWLMFEHYAFGGVEKKKGSKFVEIGKQILNKCGMLPLAVKSIASLLRHEAEEENWRDILESELWECDASNEIFSPLQISYARLPTYLKSCFLYCSMFPKGYFYDVGYLVKLWMYQGFIGYKGNKIGEKIGFEYVEQLCQRSFFEWEGKHEGNVFVGQKFKLHDIVHDLANFNLENGCHSIEVSKLPNFPNVLYHLYIAHGVNLIDRIPFYKFTTLRTLITGSSVQNIFSSFDLSMAPKLRALDMLGSCELESLSSVGNLKHLCYLSLENLYFENLPEGICSLCSLQNLTLRHSLLIELPTKIGNLISLKELTIDHCFNLEVLPKSLTQLKALRKLFISSCYKIKELPNDIENLVSLEDLRTIDCRGLQVLPGSLCQLKALRKLRLIDCKLLKELPSGMGSLTNLQTLKIGGYGGIPFLEWIGNLCKLKYLNISFCNSLQVLKAESLPLELDELEIIACDQLESMPGIQKLKSLVKLSISNCGNLCSFMEPSLELIMCTLGGSYQSPLLGLTNLVSLRSLQISNCLILQVLADELPPLKPCKVEVFNCPGLREWCWQHRIIYQDFSDYEEYEDLFDNEEYEEDLFDYEEYEEDLFDNKEYEEDLSEAEEHEEDLFDNEEYEEDLSEAKEHEEDLFDNEEYEEDLPETEEYEEHVYDNEEYEEDLYHNEEYVSQTEKYEEDLSETEEYEEHIYDNEEYEEDLSHNEEYISQTEEYEDDLS